MSEHPTLLKDVEQFLYTHAQNMPYKRNLLVLIQTWETAYQQRILELEKVDNAGNHMESEGGPVKKPEPGFNPDAEMDIDLRGTRYDDLA